MLTWAWPALNAIHAPESNPPVVVGKTVWIITEDGHVKKGRLLGEAPSDYLMPETSKANIPRP